ncbi:MAG: hypothetical protein NWE89_05260 [Candidatus Bathyarchaeota archaeon]|nr:hypothetical protein [Candidatus Bathyarchaeota archaeon]
MISKTTAHEIIKIVLERYDIREELPQEDLDEMLTEIQECVSHIRV